MIAYDYRRSEKWDDGEGENAEGRTENLNRFPGTLVLGVALAAAPASLAQHMNATMAPCQHPAANAETAQCFAEAAKAADEKLNQTYGSVSKYLSSASRPEDKEALQKAQRLWIAFRDANCAAVRGLYGNGTGGAVDYLACMEAQTRQRTADLMTGYGWLLLK